MMIGGNVLAELQTATITKNSIGESVKTWTTSKIVYGWLDMQSGDSKYTTYNAKIQESTHIFIMDYESLGTTAEKSRLVIDGKVYDVLMIDDPLGMHCQIEIYLKYTGGQ